MDNVTAEYIQKGDSIIKQLGALEKLGTSELKHVLVSV